MFKLELLVKVIRLKFGNLFRENVVKVVGIFQVSLKVTFIGQLSKQYIFKNKQKISVFFKKIYSYFTGNIYLALKEVVNV